MFSKKIKKDKKNTDNDEEMDVSGTYIEYKKSKKPQYN
jgi:hypothetical protein